LKEDKKKNFNLTIEVSLIDGRLERRYDRLELEIIVISLN